MKKIIGTIVLALAFLPYAHAQDTVGDKVVNAKRATGAEIRKAGRAVKSTGRKARQAVITRCADGRHTAKGARGCRGHGGVQDPK